MPLDEPPHLVGSRLWPAVLGLSGAYVVSYAMIGLGDGAWRWMLASGAIPALALRIRAPESPRWLAARGRHEEARQVVDKHLGEGVVVEEEHTAVRRAGMRELFAPDMWRRTVFSGVFWMCQVMPYFAIGTFAPPIVGSVAGFFVIDAMPRRVFLGGSFAVAGVALTVFAVSAELHAVAVATVAFALYGLVLSAGMDLEQVYPPELFPTELRATGVGVATAISRIGAVGSTFLLPTVLDRLGPLPTLLGLALVLFAGFAATAAWAPETRGLPLTAASGTASTRETERR